MNYLRLQEIYKYDRKRASQVLLPQRWAEEFLEEKSSINCDTMLNTWKSAFAPDDIVEAHSVQVDLQTAS